jgi:transglutaminase/protease-like cytokinesis protein 3
MTAKRDFRLQATKKRQGNKYSSWFVSVVLGVSLCLTVGNIQTALKFWHNQQLIPLQSELYDSSKYQPIELGSPIKIAQQDFSKIDRIAKNLNYSGTSISELAKLLAQNTTTEAEKARIIYAWVTQHITYDVSAFLDAVNNDQYPDVSPEKVLRDRTTICSGYSNLYQALAEAMNLKSVIVIGYAKGATPDIERFQDVNHAWNGVKIDGAWYLLDATWGAGSINNDQFKPNYLPYYFATAPSELINNHFPKDSGWQLLSQTYTRTEFDNLPNIASRFYDLGLELVSHDNYLISAQNRVDIVFKAPQDILAIADLQDSNQAILENATLVNRKGDNLIISVAPPTAGNYDLKIYAKHQDDPDKYGEIIDYQITTTQAAVQLPQVYGHFQDYQASLIEPLTRDLKPNWSTYFNLVVPQAIDVQVVNTTTNEATPLNGYGNYFAGHVDIQEGNTIVIAKFPGNDQYWQLVEYQSR